MVGGGKICAAVWDWGESRRRRPVAENWTTLVTDLDFVRDVNSSPLGAVRRLVLEKAEELTCSVSLGCSHGPRVSLGLLPCHWGTRRLGKEAKCGAKYFWVHTFKGKRTRSSIPKRQEGRGYSLAKMAISIFSRPYRTPTLGAQPLPKGSCLTFMPNLTLSARAFMLVVWRKRAITSSLYFCSTVRSGKTTSMSLSKASS